MKNLIALTAVVATLAAPAFANADFAISHFNQDKDSVIERIAQPAASESAVVSTNNRSDAAVAFGIFNASVDSVSDLRGLNGGTLINGGHSAVATEIFAELRAESLENE